MDRHVCPASNTFVGHNYLSRLHGNQTREVHGWAQFLKDDATVEILTIQFRDIVLLAVASANRIRGWIFHGRHDSMQGG